MIPVITSPSDGPKTNTQIAPTYAAPNDRLEVRKLKDLRGGCVKVYPPFCGFGGFDDVGAKILGETGG